MERNIRTKLLVGNKGVKKLNESKVIVFGVGGVGGYVVEALCRAGVGTIDIVDKDIVVESNINRQIIANYNTIGMKKVDVLKDRMLNINPELSINTYPIFYLPGNSDIDFNKYDYIIDAIDTVTSKIDIIEKAKKYNKKVISAMGAGNKIKPDKFKICKIEETKNCPLARVLRRELKKRNIRDVKVVYSTEIAIKPESLDEDKDKNKKTPGSISYNPGICGLLLAGEVINDLLES